MTVATAQRTGTDATIGGFRLTDRRQLRRSKIFTPVTLDIGECSVRAHLLDIGTGGALCFTETALRRGAIVDIAWHGAQWAAQVVWARNRRFGLRFLSPLTLATVHSIIDTPTA